MPERPTLEDLYRIPVPSQPVLAPDGGRVAFVVTQPDRQADENRSSLWWVRMDGSNLVQLSFGPKDTSPAWSPDGAWIAFLRPGEAKQLGEGGGDRRAQVWLLPVAGGEPRQLTRLPLGAGEPRWSPDGTRIAFAALVGRHDKGARPDQEPVVVETLDAKVDGEGLVAGVRRQVFVVDVAGGEAVQVTAEPAGAANPAWSPDGRQLAYSAPTVPDPGLAPDSAAYVIDLPGLHAGPIPGRRIGPSPMVVGPIAFSADGQALLAVGRMGTEVGHNRLLRLPLGGGEAVDLTSGLDRNVMPGAPAYPGSLPQPTDGGSRILFCARDRGCTHVYTVDPGGNGPPAKVLGQPDQVVTGVSALPGRDLFVAVVASPRSAGEVVVRKGGTEKVLTSLTAEALPGLEPLVFEEREVSAPDGQAVHAFVLRDPAAPAPGPLLLDVHGGPHNAWSPVLDPAHLYHHELAAAGWTVLLANPRGSDGYGESFYRAVSGTWGISDRDDFMAAVDTLVAEGLADSGRLAVGGYSYGGYTTCWLTTQTDRFAAAVAGGCVSDLRSMAGTSDVGHFLGQREVGDLPWQDPERYELSSPIAHASAVTTPTLVLHGEDDDRCPIGQAEQWFSMLRAKGVPTRLVRYPGASHLFILNGRPSHRVHYGRQVQAWLEEHSKL
jgi:dipeptidyl aminopeptidase/acylaminoacyl peptidase